MFNLHRILICESKIWKHKSMTVVGLYVYAAMVWKVVAENARFCDASVLNYLHFTSVGNSNKTIKFQYLFDKSLLANCWSSPAPPYEEQSISESDRRKVEVFGGGARITTCRERCEKRHPEQIDKNRINSTSVTTHTQQKATYARRQRKEIKPSVRLWLPNKPHAIVNEL